MEIRRYRREDLEQVAALRREAFGVPMTEAPWEHGGWVLEDHGRVQAIALIQQAGQFFGGRRVSCALVGSVAVASHERGKGYGSALLGEILRQNRRDGVLLSTLYPTLMSVYRGAGYEIAGSRTRYRQPIATLPRHREGVVAPLDSMSLDQLSECYLRFARQNDGLLDRPNRWWERLHQAISEKTLLGAVARSGDRASGYVLHSQKSVGEHPDHAPRGPLAGLGFTYSLDCHDLIWTDGESARALLDYAAASRPLGVDLMWFGPFPDPLDQFQAGQDDRVVDWTEIWMARLLNVAGCLEARAYSPELSAFIELEVVDETLPENSGAIRIGWANGNATVGPAGHPTARVDAGALASIYTGWMRPRDAARTGRLTYASDREVGVLEAAFGGSSPWMMDIF